MVTRWLGAVSLVGVLGCSAGGDSSGPGPGGGAGGTSGTAGDSGASGGSGGSGASASGGGAGTAGGSKKIGEACTSDEQCTDPPDAECFTTIGGGPVPSVTFPGGYCSKACDSGGDSDQCGASGGCTTASVAGGMSSVQLSICTAPCSSDAECRTAEGYKCVMVLPGFGYCSF